MTTINRTPLYNLGAVLRETGLRADVLRIWERRYELPKPQRTPGGHRLYSDYDLAIIKWLQAHQAKGLSISRAVELWKGIVAAGLDPLAEHTPANTELVSARLPAAADTQLVSMRQHWLEAVMAFDSTTADDILNQAFAIHSVETVCSEILQHGIRDIGSAWHADQASVQQEHFASSLVSRRLEMLIASTPPPTRPQNILIGCPPGEWHTLPMLLLSLFLRRRGLGVVYLGADIPVEQMSATASTLHPDLIIFAAQRLTTAASLRFTVQALHTQGIPLGYGGMIFNRVPRLRERIPATFLGETLDSAMQLSEQMLSAPASFAITQEVGEHYRELVRLWREKRPMIEMALNKHLEESGVPTQYLGEANYFFGNSLCAALELGDPAFLEPDLEWVKRLLTYRPSHIGSIADYLAAYHHAIDQTLGAEGAPINDWINTYRSQPLSAETQ